MPAPAVDLDARVDHGFRLPGYSETDVDLATARFG